MHDKLKDVETAEQLRACYPVMRELRPHLQTEEEFVTRVTRMGEQG